MSVKFIKFGLRCQLSSVSFDAMGKYLPVTVNRQLAFFDEPVIYIIRDIIF